MSTSIDQDEIEVELAYRRGVSHGFEIGLKMNKDNFEEMRRKILEWRWDLNNKNGIPGSSCEEIQMCN